MKKEIFEKIVEKKDFSQLPRKDVETAFSHFEKRQVSDMEKIRLTRELLHKVFGAFGSKKLLSLKDKEPEWILKKHLSTRERFPFYKEVYGRIFSSIVNLDRARRLVSQPHPTPQPPTLKSPRYPPQKLQGNEITVFDLGAGVNGFSYDFISNALTRHKAPTTRSKLSYIAVEAVGQWVKLMDYYFKTRGIGARAIHESLFEIDKVKKYLKQVKGKKIVFLFKTLDSLEMMQRDYSKKLISEIVLLADRVVVSFATQSMVKRKRFGARRSWIVNFLEKEFKIFDDFSFGGERYIVFGKNKD